MSQREPSFTPTLFAFLDELAANNRRDWFEANRERYEDEVLHPALQFISDFGPRLAEISPHLQAIPKRSGGSLFRIYRDVRFARDKRPYKTHVGIQFRHRDGRDVHAPCYYLHLEPGGSFAGAGIYRPGSEALRLVRQALDAQPQAWRTAAEDPGFRRHFKLRGDALKRAPKGYDADHPLIEDLKRKDFIGFAPLSDDEVTAPGLLQRYEELCSAGVPFVRFLCGAVGVPF